MAKYRVMSGRHAQGIDDRQVINGEPNPRYGKPRIYLTGDVVESDTDLVRRFNSRDSIKFQRLTDDAPGSSWAPDPVNPDADGLTAMTVQELRAHAAAEEIDLAGATKKEDIIAAIRAVVGAV